MIELLVLNKIMKQVKNNIILKNIILKINQEDIIGIKCLTNVSEILFDIIEHKITPTSGVVIHDDIIIMSDRRTDQLYVKQTVSQYLNFFNRIAGNKMDLEELMIHFSLIDCWNLTINQLSFTQQKRVCLFRMALFKPNLILIESPLIDMNHEEIELYIKGITYLREQGIAILFSSSYLEELIILVSKIYQNTDNGLELVDMDLESNDESDEKKIMPEVFKISCKMEDRIIYFAPKEIEYIESINSISHVYVNGECFQSTLTMNELEKRLKQVGFFRCHRSYLVNLQLIRELISYSRNSYTLILSDLKQTKVPLARTRLDEMKDLLEA